MGKKNKSTIHTIIFMVFLSIFFVGTLTAEQLAIKAGFILDTKTGQLLKDKTIIIKDNQILEITDSIPPDTKIIDLSDSNLCLGYQ